MKKSGLTIKPAAPAKTVTGEVPAASPVTILWPVLVPRGLIVVSGDNPNEMEGAKFSALVEQVKKYGFWEPLQISLNEDGQTFTVIGGHHRLDVADVLGMPELPCVILNVQEDELLMLMARLNLVRGKLNPFKFTQMFKKLTKRHTADQIRSGMALTSESEWRRLYQGVRGTLPPAVAKRLDAAKKDIHDVEDLARVVQRLMAEAHDEIEHHYVVFQLGGHDHLVVRCTQVTWDSVLEVVAEVKEKGWDMNFAMSALLQVSLEQAFGWLGVEPVPAQDESL